MLLRVSAIKGVHQCTCINKNKNMSSWAGKESIDCASMTFRSRLFQFLMALGKMSTSDTFFQTEGLYTKVCLLDRPAGSRYFGWSIYIIPFNAFFATLLV